MSNFTYYVKVSIVGPYVPPTETVFDGFNVLADKVLIEKWDEIVTGLDADPSQGSANIILKNVIQTKEATVIIMKITHDNASAREAYRKAEQIIKNLTSLLTISVSGNRYLFKIDGIHMEPTKEFPHPYESAPSENMFAMDYAKNKVREEQLKFINEIGGKIQSDPFGKKVLEVFGEAIQAEFLTGTSDEKAVILYYTVIELIAQNYIASLKKKENEQEYEKALSDLNHQLNKNMKTSLKLKYFREATSKIKEIDQSIISNNIINTGKNMNFNDQDISILKKLIVYRNKHLVHGKTSSEGSKLNINFVDYREIAKEFFLFYFSNKYNLNLEYLKNIPQQKEVSNWYNVSYLNSVLKQKSD
jgi:hypothetical protein